MQAFHNSEAVKEQYLARVRAHRTADQLIKGTYWDDGKGCAVGCTVHSGDHSAYESELGIPSFIARLEDGIFERLPNAKAMEWPEQFLVAIPVGADLSKVGYQFMAWMLGDPEEGVIKYATHPEVKKVVLRAAEIYQNLVEGGIVGDAERSEAIGAALAVLAARAVLDASDARAALAVLAARAVLDASDALDARAALETSFVRMSEKLIELLGNAPVPIAAVP